MLKLIDRSLRNSMDKTSPFKVVLVPTSVIGGLRGSTANKPFRRPSCQAREEKRKFSPTATSLRRRRQRSRTWATAQRALAEERKWRPKVHQARRDDPFSSRFLSLLLTAAIVPTRPTPLLLCSPLPLSLSDQVWCIQRCDCVNCT